MENRKILVCIEYDNDEDGCISTVDGILSNSVKPDLVFVVLQDSWFVNRIKDVPDKLR